MALRLALSGPVHLIEAEDRVIAGVIGVVAGRPVDGGAVGVAQGKIADVNEHAVHLNPELGDVALTRAEIVQDMLHAIIRFITITGYGQRLFLLGF